VEKAAPQGTVGRRLLPGSSHEGRLAGAADPLVPAGLFLAAIDDIFVQPLVVRLASYQLIR
jgi:hypothetical protein